MGQLAYSSLLSALLQIESSPKRQHVKRSRQTCLPMCNQSAPCETMRLHSAARMPKSPESNEGEIFAMGMVQRENQKGKNGLKVWRQKSCFSQNTEKYLSGAANLISQRCFLAPSRFLSFIGVYITLSHDPAPILGQSPNQPTGLNRPIAPGIQSNTVWQELARLVPSPVSVLLSMIHAVETGANQGWVHQLPGTALELPIHRLHWITSAIAHGGHL